MNGNKPVGKHKATTEKQNKKGRTEENKRLQNATKAIMKQKCCNAPNVDNENEI